MESAWRTLPVQRLVSLVSGLCVVVCPLRLRRSQELDTRLQRLLLAYAVEDAEVSGERNLERGIEEGDNSLDRGLPSCAIPALLPLGLHFVSVVGETSPARQLSLITSLPELFSPTDETER